MLRKLKNWKANPIWTMKNLCSQRVSGKSSFQFFSFYNSGNVLELFLKGDQAKNFTKKAITEKKWTNQWSKELTRLIETESELLLSKKLTNELLRAGTKAKVCFLVRVFQKSLYIWWAYTDRSMNKFTANTIIQLPNRHDKHNTGKEKNGLINWFVLVLPHRIVKT